MSSHTSGNMYIWSTEDSLKSSLQPVFSLLKTLGDTTIYHSKPKGKSQPLYRWKIGHGSINAFEFSPNTTHMAVVSQDGYLRVFDFHKQELHGTMRSYYGGLLCLCWSPDGKYIVTGGEDDFVSVWSFESKRAIVRGEGHKSYVNSVSFDAYTTQSSSTQPLTTSSKNEQSLQDNVSHRGSRFFPEDEVTYRFGSVGQDGLLCFWELTRDSLKITRPFGRTRSKMSKQASIARVPNDQKSVAPSTKVSRTAMVSSLPAGGEINHAPLRRISSDRRASATSNVSKKSKQHSPSPPKQQDDRCGNELNDFARGRSSSSSSIPSAPNPKHKKKKKKKKEKPPKEVDGEKSITKTMLKKVKHLTGLSSSTSQAQRRCVTQFESSNSGNTALSMHDVNSIEPLVCKKISHERLSDIVFREECMLTACQDGYTSVWIRPGHEPVIANVSEPLNHSQGYVPPGVSVWAVCSVELMKSCSIL